MSTKKSVTDDLANAIADNLNNKFKDNKVAYFLLLVGVILFCGSLYLLSFFSFSWLGPITPVGGIFLILGWVTLSRKPN